MMNRMVKEIAAVNGMLRTAAYIRLSREDGDKAESFSIANQRMQLLEYIDEHEELILYQCFIDDGYTGTNFERPAFKQMLLDIENKKIQCIIVKDLSRLGRELSQTTYYINEYFPSRRIRFIAVNDGVDKDYLDVDTSVDIMIDFKNMFNGFYPKDIARKVRSTFRTKQKNGLFIGAFASYGYKKDPMDHNRLIIDDYAAVIIRRIFNLYINGEGKNSIAKILNMEDISCPSVYKKQNGLNYHNSKRLDSTSYWTYASISRILNNEMYIGKMVQNKTTRQVSKKRAISLPKEKWIIVENTHEPIIDMDTWKKVQNLLKRNTRQMNLNHNIHKFAGFLQCGDCGRSMVKIKRSGTVWYNCGSYNRYGKSTCTIHSIMADELEKIILNDLNVMILSVKDMKKTIEEEQQEEKNTYTLSSSGDISRYKSEINKIQRKKEKAYEDYTDDVISKTEYLKYKARYEEQIEKVKDNMNLISCTMENQSLSVNSWIARMLERKKLEELDREIIVDMIDTIYIHENKTIRIIYNFSDELEVLLSEYDQKAQPV